jgi:hypothetical protein
MQRPSPQPVSFTSFPRELRDLIYEFALIAHDPIVVFKAKLQCIAWYEYDEDSGQLTNSSVLAGEPDFKYTVDNKDT